MKRVEVFRRGNRLKKGKQPSFLFANPICSCGVHISIRRDFLDKMFYSLKAIESLEHNYSMYTSGNAYKSCVLRSEPTSIFYIVNGNVIIFSYTAAFIFNTLPALCQSLKCIPTAPIALPNTSLCHQYC